MCELNFKPGDRVNVVTRMGPQRYRLQVGTVIKLHKNTNNITVVLDCNKDCKLHFKQDGTQCGNSWKNYTTFEIEKLEVN